MSLPKSNARKLETVCKDGTVIWRYETAQDRLLKALEENHTKRIVINPL